MKALKSLLLFTIITFLASSCTFYKPTLLTTPIVEEKGEIIIGGSTLSSSDGFILYSPIQHIALKAEAGTSYDVEYSTTINGVESYSASTENLNYEFALGYYDSLSSNVLYQVYAGYAFGENGAFYEDAGFIVLDGLYSAEYTNPFVQASFQLSLNNNMYLGLNLRGNFLEFSNLQNFDDSTLQGFNPNFELDDPSKFVGQVGMDLRYRGHTFGAFLGMHHAFSPDESGYFSVRNFNMNLGIYLRLDALFRKD